MSSSSSTTRTSLPAALGHRPAAACAGADRGGRRASRRRWRPRRAHVAEVAVETSVLVRLSRRSASSTTTADARRHRRGPLALVRSRATAWSSRSRLRAARGRARAGFERLGAGRAGRGSASRPAPWRRRPRRWSCSSVVEHRDVRVDLLAGDELELVDDALVVRVGHGEEDAVAAHEDGQDPVRLGHLARHHVEVLEDDGDLGEVDAGDAVLLGEGAQGVDLLDGRRRRRAGRRGGRASTGPFLRAERLSSSCCETSLRWSRILPSGRFSSLDMADRGMQLPRSPEAYAALQHRRSISPASPGARGPKRRAPMASPRAAATSCAVEVQVVEREEPQGEDLAGEVEVAEVRARVAARQQQAQAQSASSGRGSSV